MTSVYSVGSIKDVEFEPGKFRRYVAVDGGMADNIRPVLYAARYTCFTLSRAKIGTPDFTPTFARESPSDGYALARVVGKHCESGDILIAETYLPENLTRGDLLCIPVTGAYSYSMASNYNLLPKPQILRQRGRKLSVMVPRQRFEDLLL